MKEKAGKGSAARSESDPSSGSSPSDNTSSSSSSPNADMPVNAKKPKARKLQLKNPASSSSSDSEAATKPPKQESAKVEPTTIANPLKRKVADSNDVQLIKKRRTSENAYEMVTATRQAVESPADPQSSGNRHKEKPGRVANTPFQRVHPDKVPQHFIQDNGYTAKVEYSIQFVTCPGAFVDVMRYL